MKLDCKWRTAGPAAEENLRRKNKKCHLLGESRTRINIERVGLWSAFHCWGAQPLSVHGTHDCERRRDAGREPNSRNYI